MISFKFNKYFFPTNCNIHLQLNTRINYFLIVIMISSVQFIYIILKFRTKMQSIVFAIDKCQCLLHS